MNDENLITFADRPEDEQREISRKGGQASGEARRQRKTMRERLEYLMTTPNSQGIEHGEAIAETLVKCATEGNVKAAKLIGDYCGDFKQRIEFEDTTPKMSKEEAAAIYWLNASRQAGRNPLSDKKEGPTPLFEDAMELLREDYPSRGGKDEGVEFNLRFIRDMLGRNCDLNGNVKEKFAQCRNECIDEKIDVMRLIKTAVVLPNGPDAVKRIVEDATKELGDLEDEVGGRQFFRDLVVFYICARMEQYRIDHPEEVQPREESFHGYTGKQGGALRRLTDADFPHDYW